MLFSAGTHLYLHHAGFFFLLNISYPPQRPFFLNLKAERYFTSLKSPRSMNLENKRVIFRKFLVKEGNFFDRNSTINKNVFKLNGSGIITVLDEIN